MFSYDIVMLWRCVLMVLCRGLHLIFLNEREAKQIMWDPWAMKAILFWTVVFNYMLRRLALLSEKVASPQWEGCLYSVRRLLLLSGKAASPQWECYLSSVRGLPLLSNKAASTQWEGCLSSVRMLHILSENAACPQWEGCLSSVRRLPHLS